MTGFTTLFKKFISYTKNTEMIGKKNTEVLPYKLALECSVRVEELSSE